MTLPLDLFVIFPDLPWPRIGRPPVRQWEGRPSPARPPQRLLQPALRLGSRQPGVTGLRHPVSQPDEWQRILAIALAGRKRARASSAAARALDQIMRLAEAALRRS